MKYYWLALFFIIGMALTVPAVSAKIIEEKDGYIVTSGDNTFKLSEIFRSVSSSVSQGQIIWHSTSVPAGKTAFCGDLYWGDSTDSLSLTVVAPDRTFGPYYDSADGGIDGRINIRISKSGGIVSGTWWSEVYGYSVSGTQNYTYYASAS